MLGHAGEIEGAIALGLLDGLREESGHAGVGRPRVYCEDAESKALKSDGAGPVPFNEARETAPWGLITSMLIRCSTPRIAHGCNSAGMTVLAIPLRGAPIN